MPKAQVPLFPPHSLVLLALQSKLVFLMFLPINSPPFLFPKQSQINTMFFCKFHVRMGSIFMYILYSICCQYFDRRSVLILSLPKDQDP